MSRTTGVEKRRSARRKVLESFSVFAAIPKKGGYRLGVHDISDHGIGFDLDTDGEDAQSFPIAEGETLEVQLHLNPSLFLTLDVEVKRLETRSGLRFVGAQLRGQDTPSHRAFLAFIQLIDRLVALAG